MRAVNLLPARETGSRKHGFNIQLAAAIGLTVVVAVAVFGGFLFEKSHAGSAHKRLVAAQAALALAQSQQAAGNPMIQTPSVLAQEQPWHLALDSALSTRVSWDVLLTQLEYVTPARVSLTTVTFGSTPGVTGAPTATLTVGGYAYNLHDVAVYLSTLSRVPRLAGVHLVSTAQNTARKPAVLTFTITSLVILPTADVSTDTTTPGGTA